MKSLFFTGTWLVLSAATVLTIVAPIGFTADGTRESRPTAVDSRFHDGQWPFYSPRRPVLPDVTDKTWAAPIDRFIAARLVRAGLRPTAEAEKATLLRRVTYDLTGLPPTPEEVDAFVADEAPDAYERAEHLCEASRAILFRAPRLSIPQARQLVEAFTAAIEKTRSISFR
jgi:hypothetical protein